ncbi:MAG: hypothetical protein LZF86_20090 [Nitrospira sp.]|nr:MAG: hypothetical protein LZF86_20090 [Nitrospira sp.]
MAHAAIIAGAVFMGVFLMGPVNVPAQEDPPAYAVVSEVPKDRTKVSAKIAIDGVVSDIKLLASEDIVGNLIWKKLEICHAMRLEGQRSGEGFRVATVRAVDASMLPMALQGFAGDCLLKKALEVAPLVD